MKGENPYFFTVHDKIQNASTTHAKVKEICMWIQHMQDIAWLQEILAADLWSSLLQLTICYFLGEKDKNFIFTIRKRNFIPTTRYRSHMRIRESIKGAISRMPNEQPYIEGVGSKSSLYIFPRLYITGVALQPGRDA